MAESNQRVTLYCPTPDLPQGGGAERVMMTLARELVLRDVAVDFVVNREGECWETMHPRVPLVSLGTSRSMALPPLMRHLRRARPDALLTTCFSGNLFGLMARTLPGPRFRTVVRLETHLSRYLTSPRLQLRLRAALLRTLLPRADAIIAQCPAMVDDLAACAPRSVGLATAVPNPVDIAGIARMAAAPCPHPWLVPDRPAPTLVTASRLMPVKDIPTLLRAFARLTAARPARLLILGDGPERVPLEAMIRDLGLRERVDIAGHQPNPHAYIARADAFVFASSNEGLGNVLVEALACGTPVVSTDYQVGARDILANGRYGALVPVGDDAALAAAISDTLDNPPARAPLVERARGYDLPVSVNCYLRVLGLAHEAGASARNAYSAPADAGSGELAGDTTAVSS